ncbi:MAG: hypothetical protein ACR2II_03080 [Chthoniobacterales bacterium]
MPINPIHSGVTHSGKVLIVASSENDGDEHDTEISRAAVWDPSTLTALGDGRLMAFSETDG